MCVFLLPIHKKSLVIHTNLTSVTAKLFIFFSNKIIKHQIEESSSDRNSVVTNLSLNKKELLTAMMKNPSLSMTNFFIIIISFSEQFKNINKK